MKVKNIIRRISMQRIVSMKLEARDGVEVGFQVILKISFM
jgi:hypothetical protein